LTASLSSVSVGLFVDYESQLAREVARHVWTGLSRGVLAAGYTRTTALWESLREREVLDNLDGPSVHVFVLGQDHPDAADALGPVANPDQPHLYGCVLAVPDRPSPLAGSLLYQGVGRLTAAGVRPGYVEPALLHPSKQECEAYASRLLQRLAV
jgi:hypothetical protein